MSAGAWLSGLFAITVIWTAVGPELDISTTHGVMIGAGLGALWTTLGAMLNGR